MDEPRTKNLLLVEDEFLIALATKRQLEQYRYVVKTAHTPSQALQNFQETESIDLVLMDLDLNDSMDGIQLSKEILKIKDIPIIFLSSHNSLEFIEKTEQVTSYGFIVKSSSITVIDTSIKMAFRLYETKNFLTSELEKNRLTTKALIEKEEKLATTLNSIGDAVIVTDLQGKIIRMNPSSENLTGWKSKEAIGKPLEEIFVIYNAYSKKIVSNPVKHVLQTGDIVGLANHTTLRSKAGREYQIADSASPIRDANGNVRGVVLVFSDITEKYEDQEKIRFSESLLTESQRIAKIGSWCFDAKTKQLYWSQETYKIYGVNPDDFDLTVENYLKFIHPEDLSRVMEAGSSIEAGNVDGSFTEFRIIRDSGEIRHLRGHADKLPATPYFSERIIGTVQDVTDQKLQTERYRILFENATDAVFVSDSNFRILDLNQNFSDLIGYSKMELIGESLFIFIFEEDSKNINLEAFYAAQSKGKFESKWNFRAKDGSSLKVEIVSHRVTENSRIAIVKRVV